MSDPTDPAACSATAARYVCCVLVGPDDRSELPATLASLPPEAEVVVAHAGDAPPEAPTGFPPLRTVTVADWPLRGSLSRLAAACGAAGLDAQGCVVYVSAGLVVDAGVLSVLDDAMRADDALSVVCPWSPRLPGAGALAGELVDALLPLDTLGLARVAALRALGAAPLSDAAAARALRARGWPLAICGDARIDDAPREALPLDDAFPEERQAQTEFAPAVLAGAAAGDAPVLLHVTHNWGGGVERWIGDFCAHDTRHRHLLLRSVVGYDGYARRMELWDAAFPEVAVLQWDLALPIAGTAVAHLQARAILDEVCESHGVAGVVVSSMVGHALDVFRTGLPTVFVVHDYYPFCPAVTTWFGEVCGDCGEQRLARCLTDNEHNLMRRHVAAPDWLCLREAFAAVLREQAVRLAAPSRAAVEHLAALFPRMDLSRAEVIANGIDAALAAAAPVEPLPFPRRLRVVVPGRLAAHKGLAHFESLRTRFADRIDFILLGCGDIGRRFDGLPGVTVVSDYARADLPRLVAQQRPDCALFLSIWPETFSYTLSEMQALGVVPLARAVGAFRSRIQDGSDGLLFDSDEGLDDLLAGLIAAPERLAPLRAGVRAVEPVTVDAMVVAYDRLLALGPAGRVAAHQRLSREQHRRHALLWREHEAVKTDLAQLRHQLQGASARIAQIESEVQRQVADNRRLHDTTESLRTALASERNTLASVHAALLSEQATREAMLQSTSWKVTRPLRAMKRFLQRVKLLGHALPAAWRHAGGPVGLLGKGWGVMRRGGAAGVRRTLRDFAIVGQMQRDGVPPPPPAGEGVDARTAYFRAQFEAANRRGPEFVPARPDTGDVRSRIRAIAFYLPQFHPIAENDAWWGKGFTEWTNVAKALPQFTGHYQPRLPADLGYYDLRLPDAMRRQIELARRHGIAGFCFYHYWFSGRRLLQTPVDNFLADASLDFPFCLCWANENWTRRWDGRDDDVLIAQRYTEEDEIRFIRDLLPYLRDPRYMRVDGRPLILVYRIDDLPDPRRAVAHWREECRAAGLGDPYLLAVQSFDIEDPTRFGVDGAVEFPPHKLRLPLLNGSLDFVNPEFSGYVHAYSDVVARSLAMPWPEGYDWFRGVMPSWDNEARKPGGGTVFHGANPDDYARWLAHLCMQTDARHEEPDRKLVFINAWNEWAEGAYLEPDRRFGHAFLNATADVLSAFPAASRRKVLVVSHDAHPHGAQLLALNIARSLRRDFLCEPHILLCGEGPLRDAFAREGVLHEAHGLGVDARRALIARLREHGIEEAICNTSVVGIVVEELATAGIRCVSLVHELPGILRSYRLEASIAKIALHADKVVFPAPSVRDAFLGLQPVSADKQVVRTQGLYQGNPHWVHRARVRAEVRAELGLAEDARIVLGVGFADRRKGIDLFARTAARCAEASARTQFVWVGGRCAAYGATPEFLAEVEPVIAAGHLRMAGLLSAPDTQRLYAAADAFVLSSREDPFPSVVMEAMNAGLPVLAFEGGGGHVDLLAEGFGELVPMEDTDALAAAVLRALERPAAEREAAAEAARLAVFERFGFADYVADLLGLLGRRPPGVSVVIPNYNYARHLPARIRSVLAQTVRPREILLLDDCSTDDSVDVAERELAAGDVPWRIVRNETNQGCYAQWLRGLAMARSEVVWIAEADDDCDPRLIETLLPAFDDEQVVLSYCQSRQIDEAGRTLEPDYLGYTRDIDAQRWTHPYVCDGEREIREALVIKNTIPNASAVLMRRFDASALAPLLGELRNAGDWLVYLHRLRSGSIAYSPLALNAHRRHPGGLTMNPDKAARLMWEIVAVQRLALQAIDADERLLARIAQSNQRTWEYLGLDRGGVRRWDEDPQLIEAALDVAAEGKEMAV